MFRHQLFVDTSNYKTHNLPLYSNQLQGQSGNTCGEFEMEVLRKIGSRNLGGCEDFMGTRRP